MRRMPLLLVAIAAVPAARAVPPDRLTHSRLALLHEIEDDVRELDATLDVSSTNDGALRELERRDSCNDGIFPIATGKTEKWQACDLFKAAGKRGFAGWVVDKIKGAVNAVLAINRVQNALANGDKDLITLMSGSGGPGAPPSTFARRKSQGQQQKGPVLAGMPTQSPERVKQIAKIPSADKMDLLAEVDSDDERDWSVRGGARRGRRGSVSAGGGRSRRGSFAESGGGGEEETVMILQRGARSRRGSIAEAGARSRRGSFSESGGGGGRSRRGSMSETGGRSPQRLSRSSSRTDLSVSRDASPVGRPTSPYSGHQSNSPRVSGNVSPFQRSPRSSEGSEVGETSTTPGLPVKNLSEGSGLSVREKPAKKLSEGSGLSVLNAPEPRRSPSPGVALQDRSHRGRMGQSPLSRSPRSASPAPPGGGGGSNSPPIGTLSDQALLQGVSNRLSQSGAVQFGSGTSWAGSDDETSSRAPSPGPTPPFKELTPRSRLAKASEGSIRT